MTINQSTNNAESYLVLICRFFLLGEGGIVCLFSWILFCSVLKVFWRLFILFCCCYFLKNNWCFFSLNLSYLKTVYKICIFFRDVAFFIVIVAIPVFLV